MRTQTCSVDLKANLGRDYPVYKITGCVNNGKVELFIDDDKNEQVGTIKGDLGPTGNFAVTVYLHNSKYKRISVGATVEKEYITDGGVSIDDKIMSCFFEGIIGEEVWAELTLMSAEGLHKILVEGKMEYKN
ncbi:MAG: hypothetical protein AABX39_03810 [Nanoarchaeota archaeon]